MNTTVEQTKEKMIAVKENETALAEITTDSKVSIWGNFLYIVAVCFQDLRAYFDAFKQWVNTRLANERYGTLPWYRTKALAFQFGFDLIENTDKFNNSSATTEQIAESKIVKYSAVNEGDLQGVVVIKVATEENEELAPISNEAETALKSYFEEIKVAGTRITVINFLADKLFLTIKVKVDVLVLNLDGVHKLNGNKPIEDEIKQFFKELPFNGEFVIQDLELRLRAIEGVKIADVKEAKSSWLDATAGTYGVPSVIDTSRIPESGYYKIENFNGISYVV